MFLSKVVNLFERSNIHFDCPFVCELLQMNYNHQPIYCLVSSDSRNHQVRCLQIHIGEFFV